MKKLHQEGSASVLVLCVGLAVVGVIGFGAWHALKTNKPAHTSNASSTPSKKLAADEVEVSGSVTFARQGPTDAVIGTEPTTATLLIGPASDFSDWKRLSSVKSEVLDPDTLAMSLIKTQQPKTIKMFETPKGKYTTTLKLNTDVMCIKGQDITYTENGEQHERVMPLSCKKFFGLSKKFTADIGLIGFGANGIDCPEYACAEFDF